MGEKGKKSAHGKAFDKKEQVFVEVLQSRFLHTQCTTCLLTSAFSVLSSYQQHGCCFYLLLHFLKEKQQQSCPDGSVGMVAF